MTIIHLIYRGIKTFFFFLFLKKKHLSAHNADAQLIVNRVFKDQTEVRKGQAESAIKLGEKLQKKTAREQHIFSSQC